MTTKKFMPSYGGYQKLLSYQKAEIIYDATGIENENPEICTHIIIGLIKVTTSLLDQQIKHLVLRHKSFCAYFCVKAPWLSDRKWHCIGLILCHLRSLNHGSFHAKNKRKNFCDGVLEQDFLKKGGLRERMSQVIINVRQQQRIV